MNINKFKILFIIALFVIYIVTFFINDYSIFGGKTYFDENNFNETAFVTYKGKKILKSKLFDEYLSQISDDYKYYKKREKEIADDYLNLAYYSNDLQSKSVLKKMLIEYVSKSKNQTISKIDIIFISFISNFGNSLIIVSNAIFYCEIIGCNTIILKDHQLKRRWLIEKPVFIKKLNITITQGHGVDCQKNNILCFYEINWNIYEPKLIMPQIRTDFLKEEILRNLPYVNIDPDSLYIHIRGGNAFSSIPHTSYAQPPLCFYEKILKNNKFKDIYIVSEDSENLIIGVLINKYKKIIHNINHFEYDISLLSHAYNLVISVSSFSLSSAKINNNLKNLWEFDMIKLSEKIRFLHHHFYKFNIKYKIYTMKPSNLYMSKMFIWKKTPEQLKLMLEDKCPYNFVVTKSNI